MSELSHSPVMVKEVISFLRPENKKLYFDGTFGQGGYTKEILDKANCSIFAIDRDRESKKYADNLKKKYKSRFTFKIDKLSNINSLLKKEKKNLFDGIVLDLGVSNTQLNNPSRGFSFSKDGPLDMRMDSKEKLTAEIIINEFCEKDLSDIFFYYGDERNSRKIAKSIINFRKKKKLIQQKFFQKLFKK